MKKLLLFTLFLFALACRKEPVESNEPLKLPCEIDNFGSVKLINQQSYGINVYLDGNYIENVAASSEKLIGGINAESYIVKGIQSDGFILFPDEYNGSVTVNQCRTSNITF